MTNLTEQWNKDKLKDGFYYVAIDEPFMPKKVEIIEYYKTGFETDMDSNYMHEVLAEVPSYDEYIKLLSDSVAKIEGEEINAELKEDYNDLRKQKNEADNVILEQMAKVRQLKELLKECKEIIEWHEADCGYKDAPTENVLAKIDQVLADNKIQANTVACNKIQENK